MRVRRRVPNFVDTRGQVMEEATIKNIDELYQMEFVKNWIKDQAVFSISKVEWNNDVNFLIATLPSGEFYVCGYIYPDNGVYEDLGLPIFRRKLKESEKAEYSDSLSLCIPCTHDEPSDASRAISATWSQIKDEVEADGDGKFWYRLEMISDILTSNKRR